MEERAADFSSTDDDDNIGSSDNDSDDELPLGSLADRNPCDVRAPQRALARVRVRTWYARWIACVIALLMHA